MKQVRPKKNLGQHFLTDLNIAKAIADTVDACPDLPILEVGPGMGVMTQYLVEKPRPFKVVEIDRESVAYLQEHFPEFTRSEERGTRNEERGETFHSGHFVGRQEFGVIFREIQLLGDVLSHLAAVTGQHDRLADT